MRNYHAQVQKRLNGLLITFQILRKKMRKIRQKIFSYKVSMKGNLKVVNKST